MTAVNCPLCELRFSNRNERDWHLRNEHRHAHTHHPAERAAPAADQQDPASQPESDPEEQR
jgi:hypothetical protein